ncbi:predicted protein [Naegleria gruberi]|uniref:Predicted protein n=1 Tax=Naegleria gruberi TaxID=5762 RepID=D2V3G8_NAEGR|nr:uncharacterized protein NAEGRDRAFT_63357 [Naegleria gruberi]EFC48635.1 predicted protein [Naegleria gruberi]|eukprot:XP_002681379.1 predicted protein [Naegleria gruberi strain NEG-M]
MSVFNDLVSFTLIDFSFGNTSDHQLKLTEKYKLLTIHRRKIEENIQIFIKAGKIKNELRNDEEYCFRVVQIDGTALSKVKCQNRKIALAAVQQNGHAYVYLRKEFKKDLEILFETAKSCSSIIACRILSDMDSNTDMPINDKVCLARYFFQNKPEYSTFLGYSIPLCLKLEREFILELISNHLSIIPPFLISCFNNDRNFILEVLKKFKHPISAYFIQGLSTELRNDLEVVSEIIKRNRDLIKYVPELLKSKLKIFESVKEDYNASKRLSPLDSY